MTYKEFILSLPLQEDATINWMQKFVREDGEFPDTKNVEDIIKHVYLLFNHKQTLAFQKSLIMFLELTGDSTIMNAVNKIVEMQDSDPNYPYAAVQ